MPRPDPIEEVPEVFNRDTTHTKARAVVDAVLDLHHYWEGRCYECSRLAPVMGISWPCKTVRAIRRAAGIDGA